MKPKCSLREVTKKKNHLPKWSYHKLRRCNTPQFSSSKQNITETDCKLSSSACAKIISRTHPTYLHYLQGPKRPGLALGKSMDGKLFGTYEGLLLTMRFVEATLLSIWNWAQKRNKMLLNLVGFYLTFKTDGLPDGYLIIRKMENSGGLFNM